MKIIYLILISFIFSSCSKSTEEKKQDAEKAELNNFIGKPYKRHDPSKLKSCTGECK